MGSFAEDKEPSKPPRKPYEVEYKVLSPEDIEREQAVQVNEVSAILGLPTESAAILLRYGRWNRERLIESYMDDPDRVLDDAGLGPTSSKQAKTEVIPGFMCAICCDEGDDIETYAMRCGHRFCVDCYRHYLSQKITEEGEAARIQCPQEQCNRIVDSKTLGLLVNDKLTDR
jgi:ariadne-1